MMSNGNSEGKYGKKLFFKVVEAEGELGHR
jgi:hypothetical protein